MRAAHHVPIWAARTLSVGATVCGLYDRGMDREVGPHRPSQVRRTGLIWLQLVTVLFGVVAVGATAELFFANVDICGGSPGWWLAGVFLSPLIFVALCTWCATFTTSEVAKTAWVGVGAFLMLPYIYGAAAALLTGGLLTTWC